MQIFGFLASLTIPAYYVILLPFVECSSHEDFSQPGNHNSIKQNIQKQLSPQMTSSITIHGLLLWVSMGFLMPLGILTIRMWNREESGGKAKLFLYLHIILQILSVLLATIGGVISIKNFDNSFNNNHQRLGLALYVAMWVQALSGIFKPSRGNKRRSTWYFVHWLLGTAISLVGIINIYTGLRAYHDRTRRSSIIWTVLFTAEISFLAFFYLFQDKWEYMQKQGVTLGNNVEAGALVITDRDNQKVMLPEPCRKHNALMNLFD